MLHVCRGVVSVRKYTQGESCILTYRRCELGIKSSPTGAGKGMCDALESVLVYVYKCYVSAKVHSALHAFNNKGYIPKPPSQLQFQKISLGWSNK